MSPDASGFTVADAPIRQDAEGGKPRHPPQRERIIEAVLDAGTAFWADADGQAFADVPRRGTLQRHRVKSRGFKMVARSIFGEAHPDTGSNGRSRPGAASEAALADAVESFEAQAYAGSRRMPGVRIHRQDDAIVLDLGDDTWRAVRVTAGGWHLLDQTDAPLIRPDGMRALPEPRCTPGALAELRRLLNLPPGAEGSATFLLIVSWCLAALWPAGPYPVLAIDGEQGSGKTMACRMIRRIVDPHAGDLRAIPRSEDDLLIAALNGRVVAFDNVSSIKGDTADSLCRLATGAGFSKRRLYADTDEVIVNVARPVLLNGIPSLLARGDLGDRALAITLPAIPDAARRPETDLWRDFDNAAPGFLAALLDGLSKALARLPEIGAIDLPRMADFARLAIAAAPAFGWGEADVRTALAQNRQVIVTGVIEADAVADAVRAFCPAAGWEGTATTLLAALNERASEDTRRDRSWPRDATRLSHRLIRAAPALRRAGLDVRSVRTGGGGPRSIIIQRDTPTMENQRHQRHSVTGSARDPAGDADGDADRGAASRQEWRETAICDGRDAGDADSVFLADAAAGVTLTGPAVTLTRRQPPSWTQPTPSDPDPGARCACCGGAVWWSRDRLGWCCRTCHPAPPGTRAIEART